MPVTLRIAGYANTRQGNPANNSPVVVRDVAAGTPAYSGVTDALGYYNSGLLDDAKVYRAEITYDPTNGYKALRSLSSGQMGMLQVRERFHVQGAGTPCVIDGTVTAGAVNAPVMQRGGANLWGPDNDGAGTGLDADTVDGLQAAVFSQTSHNHNASYSLLAHDHAPTYAPIAHSHAYSPDSHNHAAVYAPIAHDHNTLYPKIATAQWLGNGGTTAFTVYTAPAGYAIRAAIIQETNAAGTLKIMTCTASYIGGTIMWGNSGPGADEVVRDANGTLINHTGAGNRLQAGNADAAYGMNWSGSTYTAIIFMEPA